MVQLVPKVIHMPEEKTAQTNYLMCGVELYCIF